MRSVDYQVFGNQQAASRRVHQVLPFLNGYRCGDSTRAIEFTTMVLSQEYLTVINRWMYSIRSSVSYLAQSNTTRLF